MTDVTSKIEQDAFWKVIVWLTMIYQATVKKKKRG